MSQADCCTWVDDVIGKALDPTSKAILSKLAAVADDDDRAWMTVALLADRVGVSERTIQSRLRMLEGDDQRPAYIRLTGDTYRMGTRDVPYYELLVDYDGVAEVTARRKRRKQANAEVRAMGAAVCTHRKPAPDAICTPMGATACTPKRESNESQGSLSFTQRARTPEAVAEEVFAAQLDEFRHRTSVREIASALRRERKRGGDIERAGAACRAHAVNRKAWGPEGGPMAPHKLIDSGRWQTAVPVDGPQGSAGKRTGFAVPAPFRAAFVLENGADGERWAAAVLDPSGWREEDQTILVTTAPAERWLRERGYRVERQQAAGKVGQ